MHNGLVLDIHGFRVTVGGDSAELVNELARDFAYFKSTDERGGGRLGAAEIRVHMRVPPYQDLPPLRASFVTPRNVCYSRQSVTYIDYFGRGLAIYDRKLGRCEIYGTDPDLVHEIAYLFVLSSAGQRLDRAGLHRVHALGIAKEGLSALVLLPSGGGKSTLSLGLLGMPGYRLLAEDTPLVDARGWIHPFPIRVGVRPEQKDGIPPEFVRTMRRMEFGPKSMIDIEYFKDRLAESAAPGLLFVGTRSLGVETSIEPISKLSALRALVKYMVVGLGVYQGLEFLLERGPWELIKQTGSVISRLRNSLALLARSETYGLVMGRDIAKNCETLDSFIEKRLRERAPAS